MQATMMLRRAPTLLSRSLLSPLSAAGAAAAAGELRPAACAGYHSTAVSPRRHWWSPPPASPRSVSLGVAGAVSFSLSLVTAVAEAKERLPAELIPKDVVLYQYEACPFCNKVKGEGSWRKVAVL